MKKINIQVLGSGCPTCKTLYNEVSAIAKKIDSALKIEYITDITKLLKLGAISSPVFAINGKIITAGKIPDEQIIEKSILEELNS